MAVYAVEGKLGTGKSKFCVWMAQQASAQGRRIAGNLDINVHKMRPSNPPRYCRIPDKPTAFDLDAMGHGNPGSYDESMNGVLILDELGTWFNSRSFQDKGRAELLDWMIHARKKGWDVYLIVQNVVMLDKQLRESLVEYSCNCMRMDKVKIPFIGWFIANIGEALAALIGDTTAFRKWGYLPFFHLVTARIGQGTSAVVADRWTYTGRDLHDVYDTRQIFRSDYEHGAFTALPPWEHVAPLKFFDRLRLALQKLTPAEKKRVVAIPKPRPLQLIMQIPDPDERVRLTRMWLDASDRGKQSRRSGPALAG